MSGAVLSTVKLNLRVATSAELFGGLLPYECLNVRLECLPNISYNFEHLKKHSLCQISCYVRYCNLYYKNVPVTDSIPVRSIEEVS